MIRSEYRRAFIMLRAAVQGCGGHARLERRTLSGSLYLVVTAPQGFGGLFAALAGQKGGEYYAAPIGALARDRRGQLTLAWPFDPRGIDGRPLEDYAWIAVATADGELALTGNVEGSRPLDPGLLRRAVRSVLPPAEEPAAELPEAGAAPEGVDPAEPPEAIEPDAPPSGEKPPEAAAGGEAQGDVRIYLRARARRAAARAALRAGRAGTAPEPETPPDPGAPPDSGASPDPGAEAAGPPADAEPPRADPVPIDAAGVQPATAARRLGLDITRPWPGAAEPLRRLFATQAPSEAPLPDGFTYVSAPMPRASGYRECLVGLMAEGGLPSKIRYALPGRFAPEPPAGMDDYRWTGDGAEGFWVLDATP